MAGSSSTNRLIKAFHCLDVRVAGKSWLRSVSIGLSGIKMLAEIRGTFKHVLCAIYPPSAHGLRSLSCHFCLDLPISLELRLFPDDRPEISIQLLLVVGGVGDAPDRIAGPVQQIGPFFRLAHDSGKLMLAGANARPGGVVVVERLDPVLDNTPLGQRRSERADLPFVPPAQALRLLAFE